MSLRTISVPHFLRISRGLNDTVAELAFVLDKLHYDRPLIICGRTSGCVLGEQLIGALGAHLAAPGAADGGALPFLVSTDNSFDEVERIRERARSTTPDVLIGIGGGKVLDATKYAASQELLPFISLPTQISNDGICSPVAVLKDTDGLTDSIGARIPVAIIVDFDVVKKSPESTIRAGIGDLVSNIFAVADWRLAAAERGEDFDDYAAMVALTAATSFYEAAHGSDAADGAAQLDLGNEALLSLLVNGLVLSGIAMELCGTSRPCSGAEHKISHAMDAFFGAPASHGEQVALGSVVSAYLHGQDWRRLKRFFRRAGLPEDPAAIGLSSREFAQVIMRAPETRSSRYTVLEQRQLSIAQAEAIVENIWGMDE